MRQPRPHLVGPQRQAGELHVSGRGHAGGVERVELREVRESGVAISDEENLPNVYSVGAAVRDASGTVIASLSGAVPRQGLTKRDIDHLCVLVKNAADSVSRKMGAPPDSLRP